MPRKLRVEFLTEEAFRREYADNISKGGTFVPSRKAFEQHELVDVELVLPEAGQAVELRGQVVHCVSADLAATGASPGVAVEFLLSPDELRAQLAPLAPGAGGSYDEQEFGAGRRAAPRSRARGSAQVCVGGRWIDGRLRNISSSGVLLGLAEEPLPVDTKVVVSLIHPTSHEELELGGVVRRHLESAGETLIGVEFRLPEAARREFDSFLARLRTSEHNRHLGGINGPIGELGVDGLLRMFGGAAPQGMLTLHRGDEEAVIAIERGMLRVAYGRRSGRDALDELLAWRDGRFEFDAQMEDLPDSERIPLDALPSAPAAPSVARPAQAAAKPWDLLGDAGGRVEEEFAGLELDFATPGAADDFEDEAARVDDPDSLFTEAAGPAVATPDAARVDAATLPPDALLSLAGACGADSAEALSKTQRALLDLAGVGVTVGKAVEIIPDPAPDVYAALTSLIAEGVVTIQKAS